MVSSEYLLGKVSKTWLLRNEVEVKAEPKWQTSAVFSTPHFRGEFSQGLVSSMVECPRPLSQRNLSPCHHALFEQLIRYLLKSKAHMCISWLQLPSSPIPVCKNSLLHLDRHCSALLPQGWLPTYFTCWALDSRVPEWPGHSLRTNGILMVSPVEACSPYFRLGPKISRNLLTWITRSGDR